MKNQLFSLFYLTLMVSFFINCSNRNMSDCILESTPKVNLGENLVHTNLTEPIRLTAIVTSTLEDNTLVYLWELQQGNGISFSNPNSLTTSATGFAEGVYEVVFTVTTSQGVTASDTLTITVSPALKVIPQVNIGDDISITLPIDKINLISTVTQTLKGDTYLWGLQQGNGISFSNPNSLTTSATGFAEGVYEIVFTVTTSQGATASDTLTITILSTKTSTYIPDDNFEKKLIELGYDDVLNNYVLTSNIVNIDKLYLNNGINPESSKISDLTGIQDFTSLEELDISDHNLTSLDISNNLLLKYLNLSRNTIATIVGGVSNNINLESLHIFRNNLTAIDISKNVNLKDFRLSEDKITSVDVSKNINLERLSVLKGNFTSIDVSKNIKLKNLLLFESKFSSIDISKNINLEEFIATNNILNSIDVTNNIKLQTIYIFGNNLTSIDVTKNISLKELLINGNNLSSLDISNNSLLKTFDVRRNSNLNCIKVSQSQLNNIPQEWIKDSTATYSISCN